MSERDHLLSLAKKLQDVCYEIGESGFTAPTPGIFGVPREVFDLIPSKQRIDQDVPDEPYWTKFHQGVTYTCWQAPFLEEV